MKKRLGALVIVLAGSAVLLASCGGGPKATTTQQTAKVQRGALVVTTTSTGNLAFTTTEDVAFDMAGTVEDVMVEVGDTVKQGQVLATLDADAWNDQLKALQKAVTTAQRNLTSAERNITAQQLAVRQAELNLQSSRNAATAIPAVKAAQDIVDNAEAALAALQGLYATNPGLYGPQITAVQAQLAQAKANLQTVLAGANFNLSTDVSLQILKAELAIDQAQRALDDADVAVDNVQSTRDDAAQALDDAQSNLADAQKLGPQVTAPFAGVVTKISVQGGQAVNKGAVAVTVADPSKFEVNVLVGERDISSMSIGGVATVSVDSMTGVVLPARITAIAPTATISQGVVNYQVTVEVESGSANITGAAPSGGFQIPSGASGQFPNRGTTGSSDNQSRARSGNFTGGAGLFATGGTSAATLRQGLSVTINLVTSAKANVLMVPNRAITKQKGQSYVTVEKTGDKGTTQEQVAVTTGISNSQYTEITEGIAEGDTVVIPITTSSSSSSTDQGNRGFMGAPGIGAVIR